MVDWFWRSSNAKGERDSFSHLPPNVRAFLESEAPVKPSRNLPPAEAEIDSSEKPKFDAAAYAKHTKYAELYTTYKPLEMVDAEYRTPATAVTDVFKSYKDRQGYIARAALENCVFEQEALHLCYGSNKLGTLSGCSKESKTSETCYKSQQGFLKLLGYMNDISRDPMVDEKIQMHADRLYREQVQREQEMEAKAAKSS